MRMQLLSAVVEARMTPSSSMLTDAPLLRDWMAALHPDGTLCLVGIIAGHPDLADGKTAYTSLLLALDPNGRWARTLSRWYQLTGTADDALEIKIRQRGFKPVAHTRAVRMATKLRETLWYELGGRLDS